MDHHSSATTTNAAITNLRWRSRLNKVAVVHDDSSIISDYTASGRLGSDDNKSITKSKQYRHKPLPSQILLWLVTSTSVASSLWCLQSNKSVWTALNSTTSFIIAVLILVQTQHIRSVGRLRAVLAATRWKHQQIQQQHERLLRNMDRLDPSLERLATCRQELERVVSAGDAVTISDNALSRTQQWTKRHVLQRQELRRHLTTQIQDHILRSVLQDNNNNRNDYALSSAAAERLLLTLQALPGVQVEEGPFRDVLAAHDRSLTAILHLLRSAAAVSSDTVARSTFSANKNAWARDWNNNDDDEDHVPIFRPEARELMRRPPQETAPSTSNSKSNTGRPDTMFSC